MGRYYHGDIEGKFWFAVQSSAAADRFGQKGWTAYLSYYYDSEDVLQIEAELLNIKTSLGKHFDVFKEFFNMANGYNTKTLEEYFKQHKLKFCQENLEDYADYGLGQKILECVKETGECAFEAEI